MPIILKDRMRPTLTMKPRRLPLRVPKLANNENMNMKNMIIEYNSNDVFGDLN
jgi:hypothetical protein